MHTLASRAAQTAEKTGSEVRLRRVQELAPAEATAATQSWARTAWEAAVVDVAPLADRERADLVLLGTPTRLGHVASQLKQYLDQLGPLWAEGKLANKGYTGFMSTSTQHGGHESTLLASYNSVHHFGGILVPPGYADPSKFADGNHYSVSHVSPNGTTPTSAVHCHRSPGEPGPAFHPSLPRLHRVIRRELSHESRAASRHPDRRNAT